MVMFSELLQSFLLAPKASEASMGAFYFRERVNGCCNGACGYCYAIRGPTHRGPKSGCKLVTLFDSYCDGGVSAAIGVLHTEVPNLGASW